MSDVITGVTGQQYKFIVIDDEQVSQQTVMEEAQSLIYGDRQTQYGDPRDNLNAIAQFWMMYLYHKYKVDIELNGEDVCWMMAQLKMLREFNGSKRDSLVDAIGYIGLIERLRA